MYHILCKKRNDKFANRHNENKFYANVAHYRRTRRLSNIYILRGEICFKGGKYRRNHSHNRRRKFNIAFADYFECRYIYNGGADSALAF